MLTTLIVAGLVGYGLFVLAKGAAKHPEAAGVAKVLFGFGKK